ncbi:hypothetical protein [Sphingomonas abaci]|uniref:Uncharacterized protein n=1 Tax=Sphingomonas abaci TaxID=237611 RepID=A0A7W7AJ66_9SPHN|nr:hypothetical protein [Sphingomonas abaci]MBB4618025.1 hypothetical protein [Sphingomonas abaci]
MTKRDLDTLLVAVSVLRAALALAEAEILQTTGVRLALRVLLLHCRQRDPLIDYWTAAGLDDPVARVAGMTDAFQAIIRQLRATGSYQI